MIPLEPSQADRSSPFFAKAQVDEGTGCWNWTAYKDRDGYGRMRFHGRMRLAHRVSFEVFCAPIPAGMYVLHCCDNPSCVNPDHLFLGTHADNMADKVSKGRQVAFPGASNGSSKLTASDVLAIREAACTQRDIAKTFGVSVSLISQIRSRKLWNHLGEIPLKGSAA